MIIDVHAHIWPRQSGPAGHDDDETFLSWHQSLAHRLWGRLVTNTLDEKYRPFPGEDIDFRVGRSGRYLWTKHGKECWMQRYHPVIGDAEWSAEQMVALMDATGVDKVVLQAGYMEKNLCVEYYSDAMKRYPERFIGTVATDYDVEKSEEHREAELRWLRDCVRNRGMKGIFQGYPRFKNVEDERLEPFWEEISRLKIVHIFATGFRPKRDYLESLDQLERVLKRHPEVKAMMTHLGGNVRHPSHPDYTDTPKEFFSLLRLPNVYFTAGYVLAFENRSVWGEDYEYPYPLHRKMVKRIYDEVGAERLLWGSDVPNNYRTCTYQQCLDLVRLHLDFMSEEEKKQVLGENAARLFRA